MMFNFEGKKEEISDGSEEEAKIREGREEHQFSAARR